MFLWATSSWPDRNWPSHMGWCPKYKEKQGRGARAAGRPRQLDSRQASGVAESGRAARGAMVWEEFILGDEKGGLTVEALHGGREWWSGEQWRQAGPMMGNAGALVGDHRGATTEVGVGWLDRRRVQSGSRGGG
jgi:hypothetical protein